MVAAPFTVNVSPTPSAAVGRRQHGAAAQQGAAAQLRQVQRVQLHAGAAGHRQAALQGHRANPAGVAEL
jgi:hypothetical protein